jgi:hypothetical protein
MGTLRTGLGALAAALLILAAGCKHDNIVKPPKEDPVFRLPPNENRYASAPDYPEKTLNDFPKRDPNAGMLSPAGGSKFGMQGPGSH